MSITINGQTSPATEFAWDGCHKIYLLDNGDAAKGVENLRKAVSLGPKLPQLRLNLARGLAKTGDKDGARKELEEAQKQAPENSPLRAEIDKVRASL